MRKAENEGKRLPPWMRRNAYESKEVIALKKIIRDKKLHTVCQSAGCPNIYECFKKPTATFLILGNVCTRNCRFCGVLKGAVEPLNPDEPEHVAQSVKILNLKHVVITSVTRDDLPDGGASHFKDTVIAVRKLNPSVTIETLIPDFTGNINSLKTVLESGVDILNHNVETVPALYSQIRPEADYNRSLSILKNAKTFGQSMITKTGIMVGLGEKKEEITALFYDLASVHCDALTIGQYLSPSLSNIPVIEYIHPDQFEEYAGIANSAGIRHVYSGPYIRSSYNAESLIEAIKEKQ